MYIIGGVKLGIGLYRASSGNTCCRCQTYLSGSHADTVHSMNVAKCCNKVGLYIECEYVFLCLYLSGSHADTVHSMNIAKCCNKVGLYIECEYVFFCFYLSGSHADTVHSMNMKTRLNIVKLPIIQWTCCPFAPVASALESQLIQSCYMHKTFQIVIVGEWFGSVVIGASREFRVQDPGLTQYVWCRNLISHGQQFQICAFLN